MKIEESRPFKSHLAACRRTYGKEVFATSAPGSKEPDNPMEPETVRRHAQAIYNELTGQGLTYMNAFLILEIILEQLRLDRDNAKL